MQHKLTSEDADKLNVGKSVDRDTTANENERADALREAGFHSEGDSVEALELPDGKRIVLTGVVDGTVQGVVLDAPDEDESDDYSDEDDGVKDNPDEVPVEPQSPPPNAPTPSA